MPIMDFFGGQNAYADPNAALTLKALQDRRAKLAAATAAASQPQQVTSVAGGLGNMLRVVGDQMQESRAAQAESDKRARFAQLLAGGLKDPASMAEAMNIDPETTMQYQQHQWAQGDIAQKQAFETAQQQRLFGHEDTAAAQLAETNRQAAAALAGTQTAQEAQREAGASALETQKAQEAKDTAATLATTQSAARQQEAALGSDIAKLNAGLQSGALTKEQYDQGVAILNAKAARESMLPGEQSVDTNFAKDYVDWNTSGRSNVQRQLAEVKATLNILNKPENQGRLTGITGSVRAALPAAIQPYINEQGTIAEQSIKDAVQNTLKAVLGSQFTAGEGERLMARAFDSRLQPQENARRAQMIFSQLETMANSKQQMAEYFQQHHTLKGYQGPSLDTTAFDSMDFGDSTTAPDTGTGTGNAKTKTVNGASVTME